MDRTLRKELAIILMKVCAVKLLIALYSGDMYRTLQMCKKVPSNSYIKGQTTSQLSSSGLLNVSSFFNEKG